MTVDGPRCPNCRSLKTGRSPTGVWCNDCGWAEPGLICGVCGRQDVNEKHKTREGKACDATPDELRKPGFLERGKPKSYLLLLQAADTGDSAMVGFTRDGAIEYRNFEPTPETRGLMEGLAALIIRSPLYFAQVLIDSERHRVEMLRDIDRRHAEEEKSDV